MDENTTDGTRQEEGGDRARVLSPAGWPSRVGVEHHEAAHAVLAEATGYGRVEAVEGSGAFGRFGRVRTVSLNPAFERRLLGDPVGERYLRAHLVHVLAGPVANAKRGDGPSDWDEELAGEDHGWFDPPGECALTDAESDYEQARVLACWLGLTVAKAWAEVVAVLDAPDVWAAVEDVAAAVAESGAGGLDRAGFLEVYGRHDLSRLRTTDLGAATEVARRWP